MKDSIYHLLKEVEEAANDQIIDEWPRHESEPYVMIWEKLRKLAHERTQAMIFNEVTGNYDYVVHGIPEGIEEQLTTLKEKLKTRNKTDASLLADVEKISLNLHYAKKFDRGNEDKQNAR